MCRNVILQHLMTENEEIMSLNLVKINKQKAWIDLGDQKGKLSHPETISETNKEKT